MMFKKLPDHKANVRRCTLVVAMALIASLGVLSVASSALAMPKGEYAAFYDCPLSNAAVTGCIVGKTESGEFVIGTKKTKVPIEKPITLQGGFERRNPSRIPYAIRRSRGREHAVQNSADGSRGAARHQMRRNQR